MSGSVFGQKISVKDSIQLQKVDIKVHSPHKATLYSLIPGMGQIYNKKYWKLPLVYGAFAGTIYGINWNNSRYTKYKVAYTDFVHFQEFKYQEEGGTIERPNTDSFTKLNNQIDFDLSSQDTDDWYEGALKNMKDKYKRDRDFMYIVTFGVYVLSIIDATVDAHFYDFSIDDDLSLRIEPMVTNVALGGNSIGLNCRFTF